MASDGTRRIWLRVSLEVLAALGLAVMVWAGWPHLNLPRLGHEERWFALGWLILLAGPSLLRLRRLPSEPKGTTQTLGQEACTWGAFTAGGLFLAMLIAGDLLGNYKLWLGVAYLSGVGLRLAGLALLLRAVLLARQNVTPQAALGAAGVAALGGLLLLPWVGIDLVVSWPPPWEALLERVLAALIWGGLSGAVLMLLPLIGMQLRAAWLAFLAVAMGPGPVLALSWFKLVPMAIALVALLALIVFRVTGKPRTEPASPGKALPLYWLVRAMMLIWWTIGAALAISAAWWSPHFLLYLEDSLWLRAVALGAFLVICLALLVEYSLPLMGRSGALEAGERYKVLGVMVSALAIFCVLTPLLLAPVVKEKNVWAEMRERARTRLLEEPITLGPDTPEIELEAPAWLLGPSSLYVVSMMHNAAGVKQGDTVVLVTAEDDLDHPYLFPFRAGVDTADWALNRSNVARVARHDPARVADHWTVHTPSGETYRGQSYFSGLYLGRQVNLVQSVRLKYVYQNRPGEKPATIEIRQVILY